MQQILLCTEFKLDENNIYHIKRLFNQETGELVDISNFDNLKDIKFYVQDLNILFVFLLKNCFKYKLRNVLLFDKMHNNTFCFNEKNGNCSTFFIQTKKGNKISFINFSTKFGVDFSNNFTDNIVLLEYAQANNRLTNSLGTDAFNEYLHTFLRANPITARELMRENYPILDIPMLERVKDTVSGYQYVKKGFYTNVYSYDITSSYPAILYNDTPYGKPHEFTNIDDIPHTYFYVVRFTVLDPHTNHIDFLNINKKEIANITLTKKLFELFKKIYTYSYICVHKIIAFKTRKAHFHKFLNKNIVQGKEQETNPRIKKYNKLFANSIVGYFGRNRVKSYTRAYFCTSDNYFQILTQEQEIDPIYLPLYLAVLDTAKAQFIQTLSKYQDILIYANTDGFLTSQQIDINELNRIKSSPIGSYKEKCKYSQIYIESINGYCGITESGEIDNTLSGMTLTHMITPDQYRNEDYEYYCNIITPSLDMQRKVISKMNGHSTIR